jgi:type II secretory pathway pseudopilin PulG
VGARDDAFTLVTLMILVTVLNVMVAAALPLWTQQIKRDKEEELIFRGLQYAEAIRLFETKFGRYPVRLQELLEVEPRSIRQLWKDPMTDDGEWGLVFATGAKTGEGGTQTGTNLSGQAFTSGTSFSQRDEDDEDEEDESGRSNIGNRGRPRRGETVTTGPISGVHSLSEEESVKVFMGSNTYNAWIFTPEIIPIAPTAPGEITPSLNSRWIGRPFPEGVEPAGGTGIDDDFGDDDEEQDVDTKRGKKREERKSKRGGDDSGDDGGGDDGDDGDGG